MPKRFGSRKRKAELRPKKMLVEIQRLDIAFFEPAGNQTSIVQPAQGLQMLLTFWAADCQRMKVPDV